MLYAIHFNLDQSKILSSGNEGKVCFQWVGKLLSDYREGDGVGIRIESR